MKRHRVMLAKSGLRKWTLMLFAVCMASSVFGQKIGVKTNLLYDATTTMNLGFEFGLAPRWTLELSGSYNPWTLDEGKNKKIKHLAVIPEARYWLCNRFQGHFFGLHSGYSQFNISAVRLPFQSKSTKNHRYQGWGTGVGLAYGYSWILGKRWNLEATFGLGYIYTNYDKYECATCGKFKANTDNHYFGPTKAGVSVIFMIN